MKFPFSIPVEQVIQTRRSVRAYEKKPLSPEIKRQLTEAMTNLSSPFGPSLRFKLIETEKAADNARLGTYGMIKGANTYIGATVETGPLNLEALGYAFEKLILLATSLGLGTCWLGGTFNRGAFTKEMAPKENELFPAISPIGYGADRTRLFDSLVRFAAKSDQRKPWQELFFQDEFSTPLDPAQCDGYEGALKMVILAPSASNKQPWRVVKQGNSFHFYLQKAKGYGGNLGFDIQRIDMGIALCHFHLWALEKGLTGSFQEAAPQLASAPENSSYTLTWVAEPAQPQAY